MNEYFGVKNVINQFNLSLLFAVLYYLQISKSIKYCNYNIIPVGAYLSTFFFLKITMGGKIMLKKSLFRLF